MAAPYTEINPPTLAYIARRYGTYQAVWVWPEKTFGTRVRIALERPCGHSHRELHRAIACARTRCETVQALVA